MIMTVMNPVTYVSTVGAPEAWDPLSGAGTNRKEDKNHVAGIARYINDTPDYVLNSILVYADTKDAYFEADAPNDPISAGVLYMRPAGKFKVGDGGHRTSAFAEVIEKNAAFGGDVLERLQTNGQPIIVVLDDDHSRRAQDFTDLQNNAKPLNASIAQSMDKRQAINRLLIDRCIKDSQIPLLHGGIRVEFLTDSPGKLSAKIMGFKTLRYATGILLIGTGFRSTRAWEEAVAVSLAKDEDAAFQTISDFWTGYGQFPAVNQALTGQRGMVILRESTWLASANVMYSIAAAAHEITKTSSTTVSQAMKALGSVDFSRAGSLLDNTLVEPALNGKPAKARTGRDAWEGAAANLVALLHENLGQA